MYNIVTPPLVFFQTNVCRLQGVKSLIDDFVRRKQPLVFYDVKPSVISIFQGVRPTEFNCCTTEQQLHEMLKGRQLIFTVLLFENVTCSIFCY